MSLGGFVSHKVMSKFVFHELEADLPTKIGVNTCKTLGVTDM